MNEERLRLLAAKLKDEMPELAEFTVDDFIPLAFNLSLPERKRMRHLKAFMGEINKEFYHSNEIPLLRYYYKIWEKLGHRDNL